jgi:hypothetical protein
MHKATIIEDIRGSPQCGATSTNSSLLYYLSQSSTSTEPQKPTPHRIGYLRTPR